MEIVVLILAFVVLWAWIEISRSKQTFSQQIGALTQRTWALEEQLRHFQTAPVAPVQAPVAPPVVAEPVVQVAPPPVAPMPVTPAVVVPPPLHVPSPPPLPAFTPAAAAPPPPPRVHVPSPPRPIPEPSPSFSQRMAGQDWESLIGGNLMNKAGALIFVIGIMLFLAYVGTQVGPAGRAGASVIVSLALLGSGVWLERRETYRVFARGLIGTGWAALYATAYAIYALPAARIIDNPFVGSFIVLVVAAGMIAHSLRYQAQGVTAVAFFSAFAALAITPNTLFAVLCLLPLAASVLYLAQRFNWFHMALMGVVATYGACAWRGSSDAPLVESELLFIGYWVLFEAFDLMRFSRRVQGWAIELIFPLNAAGFLGLSYASWTTKSPDTVWKLSACIAAMYLVSTLWRVRIELDRGADSDLATAELPARVRAGAYEAPLVLCAILAATAIVQKLTGVWVSTALALEAQALFIAGARFRSQMLRALAAAAFMISLASIGDARVPAFIDVFGHQTHGIVPLVLFHALLFYINRAMSEAGSVIGLCFSGAASLLVAVALGEELPVHYAGTGWMVLSAILFEFAMRKGLREFRLQAYVLAFFGASQSLVYVDQPPAFPHTWIPPAFGAAFAYAAAWRVSLLEQKDSANREWGLAGWVACGFTTLSATVLLVKQVPDKDIGAALFGLALVLLELGLQRLPVRLRVFAYPVAAIAALATLGNAPTDLVKSAPPQGWLPCLGSALAALIMSASLTAAPPDAASLPERSIARNVLSGVGLVFALITIWILVPDEFVPAAWAAVGLAVLEAGNGFEVLAYRLQGHAVAVFAALSAFGFTLADGHPHRVFAVALLIVVHIGFRVLSVHREGFESKLPFVHEGAAGILAAALIYQEVSGSLLTVAWGTEALVLLGTGFVFRERPLRLQGLALFLICVLKVFLYDLRNLETPYRILSFIALGLILLGVSWIYTKFRQQLQKLL